MLTDEQMKALLVPGFGNMRAPATRNPSVERCSRAWVQFMCKARLEGLPETIAVSQAQNAFRLAMPPLIGSRNVRHFIACTAYGMLLGAIDQKDASRLLYAAQVALASIAVQNQEKKQRSIPDSTGK